MAAITAAPHHDDIASSSTASCSASTSYVHYDIFISHCGRDKDAGIFATALYSHLLSRGLHVFLDKLEFMFEEEVTSQIKAAISLASVQITIFSPNYAEWKWCLDALIHMTNSEGTTFPVFYKVKPSEVRRTGKDNDGPYALWMRDHEEKGRYDLETIQNWRDVLFRVSNISGFELEACNG
jgi:hypothetical protein